MRKFWLACVLTALMPVCCWAKTFLIDVRTPEEYANGHLDGAINIEYQQIQTKISQAGVGKGDEVILYCHSGRRAGIARETLQGLGYTHVQNYGGMEEARKRLSTK